MSWLDVDDWGRRWMPTVVSGGRREEMNRFLDHHHRERGKEKEE